MAKALATLAFFFCCALPTTTLAAEVVRLTWAELTVAQRRLLAPLESEWGRYSVEQRKRWIAVADRYPKMSPAEQKRVQVRMQEWAKLTPQQRETARARYRALSKLTPEQRRNIVRQWTESQEAQQALTVETPPVETPESTRSAETGGTAETTAAPAEDKPGPAPQ